VPVLCFDVVQRAPAFWLLFLLNLAAQAQDTRHVTEPVVPQPCATLLAKLASSAGTLQVEDENHPDTVRIQQAIDGCAAGHSVELKVGGSSDAFLSGPLRLRSNVTLLIDKGVVLFASRNPRDYDISPGSCGVVDERGHGCRALINGERADHAAVMGEGAIDGRGSETLLGQKVSWWDLAQEAKVKNLNQSCPRLLILLRCNDFTLYKITLRNSPNFHVSFNQGNGFTAWGVVIDSPKTARNTDGIDPANSTNVTISQCFIHTGDDQVAIKAGGTAGPSSHMSIVHNHFYTGHGMSIGSETDAGANHILVSDLTIEGADNGIRIKSNSSRGGLVEDITYQHVCIRDTRNPIFMDTNYSYFGTNRDKLPIFQNITLRDVHISGAGKITLDGFDTSHRLQMKLDDVTIDGTAGMQIAAKHADLALGPGPVNFKLAGLDVNVTGETGKDSAADSCQSRFVPMPQRD
jgi:polygalacturonase